MGAPTIVWLRDGVGYAPDAAASMRRLERALGREHDSNSSYRDWDEQQRMFDAWNRYVRSGYDPRYKPNHSRAIAPEDSMHCKGLADDSDDWTTPGYISLAAEHGWIRTAAWDPTERHHFEYQWRSDTHRFDPEPTAEPAPKKRRNTMLGVLVENTGSTDNAPIGDRNGDVTLITPEGDSRVPDQVARNVIARALAHDPESGQNLVLLPVERDLLRKQMAACRADGEEESRLLREVQALSTRLKTP